MPKRVGNLWNTFISEENIKIAINKSIKGKRNRPNIMEIAEDPNLYKNILDLCTGVLPLHKYRKRIIYESKRRNIYVIDYYPWRIIHHMFINVVEPIFEKRFISHTYGCIRGRGQHKGSLHCQKFADNYKYVLKCDIHKFYPSIKQHILYEQFCHIIKDPEILKIAKIIIFSHKKGVPIGNLPSQLFGNIYMNAFDQFIKHDLKIKNYIKYVDDFIFVSNDKEELKEIAVKIETFLKETLGLTLSKKQLFQTKQGIDFLGYRHFPRYRLLRKSTSKRIKRRLKTLEIAYDKGKKDIEQCISTIESFKGWIKPCNSFNFYNTLNLEEIRRKITLKDFLLNGTTQMSGKKTKLNDVPCDPITVNCYKFKMKQLKHGKKPIVQIQYYTDKETYYFESGSSTLVNQFKQLSNNVVPFQMKLIRDKHVYAA